MKRLFCIPFAALLLFSSVAAAQDYVEEYLIEELTEESPGEPGDGPSISFGEDYEGVVTRVIDAGNVEIDGERMELMGVDAPRRAGDGAPRDCYSLESAKYLETRVLGKRVGYSLERSNGHDRSLGTKRIYLYRGHSMLNSELIRRGMVFADSKSMYLEEEYFRELQETARRRHAGLWHTCPVECDRFGDCDTKDW